MDIPRTTKENIASSNPPKKPESDKKKKHVDLKTKAKVKARNKPNLEKFVPYIILVIFAVMGAMLALFGWFIFNREPDGVVVLQAQQELSEMSIKFDEEEIKELFDSSYDTSDIKAPSFIPKNPFIGF